ncbi:hypothetical protein HanRHA438_Chr10g0461301 [Helianthus annuus]|nr:hypothetical protein HanIR_Chr10g0483741 [Helianthus annuus]KAJ0880275.1 hypothetical protein HanRHA438_Chr10g0461301 [Helianthus annuus]
MMVTFNFIAELLLKKMMIKWMVLTRQAFIIVVGTMHDGHVRLLSLKKQRANEKT